MIKDRNGTINYHTKKMTTEKKKKMATGKKKKHKTKEKKMMIYKNICFFRKQCIMCCIENAIYSSLGIWKLSLNTNFKR